ncbi:MAG TPA: hypothetical protein ENH99_01250 [Candidatus Pacearchaeota archaeon]|nr:hypothetical protein [Candidatus Pacearchaeota archaeon]
MEKRIFIQENNFEKARKKIRENKGKKIIFSSESDELNRKILEKEEIDVLLLNLTERKDRMKQRDSGLNHVLSKIAKKKNIKIGINLNEILDSNGKRKSDLLSRLRQNIKLANKNKLKMEFLDSKVNRQDSKALGLVLGMPTQMLKNI